MIGSCIRCHQQRTRCPSRLRIPVFPPLPSTCSPILLMRQQMASWGISLQMWTRAPLSSWTVWGATCWCWMDQNTPLGLVGGRPVVTNPSSCRSCRNAGAPRGRARGQSAILSNTWRCGRFLLRPPALILLRVPGPSITALLEQPPGISSTLWRLCTYWSAILQLSWTTCATSVASG